MQGSLRPDAFRALGAANGGTRARPPAAHTRRTPNILLANPRGQQFPAQATMVRCMAQFWRG
jgi:hypothetical protein